MCYIHEIVSCIVASILVLYVFCFIYLAIARLNENTHVHVVSYKRKIDYLVLWQLFICLMTCSRTAIHVLHSNYF